MHNNNAFKHANHQQTNEQQPTPVYRASLVDKTIVSSRYAQRSGDTPRPHPQPHPPPPSSRFSRRVDFTATMKSPDKTQSQHLTVSTTPLPPIVPPSNPVRFKTSTSTRAALVKKSLLEENDTTTTRPAWVKSTSRAVIARRSSIDVVQSPPPPPPQSSYSVSQVFDNVSNPTDDENIDHVQNKSHDNNKVVSYEDENRNANRERHDKDDGGGDVITLDRFLQLTRGAAAFAPPML